MLSTIRLKKGTPSTERELVEHIHFLNFLRSTKLSELKARHEVLKKELEELRWGMRKSEKLLQKNRRKAGVKNIAAGMNKRPNYNAVSLDKISDVVEKDIDYYEMKRRKISATREENPLYERLKKRQEQLVQEICDLTEMIEVKKAR